MGKKKYDDFNAMFGELDNRGAANVEQEQATVSPAPAPVPAPRQKAAPAEVVKEEKKVLQEKQVKQEKKAKKTYGTKRTIPIDDDLWEDAVVLMQAQGKTQIEFMEDLIRSAVEKNRDTINAIKRMRGQL